MQAFGARGLGLGSIATLNDAFNMNHYWDLLKCYESWALLLKARVLKGSIPTKYHIASSIWINVKIDVEGVSNNTIIVLGDGRNTNF